METLSFYNDIDKDTNVSLSLLADTWSVYGNKTGIRVKSDEVFITSVHTNYYLEWSFSSLIKTHLNIMFQRVHILVYLP